MLKVLFLVSACLAVSMQVGAKEHRGQLIDKTHNLDWWRENTEYDLNTRAKNYACTAYNTYDFKRAGFHRRYWTATYLDTQLVGEPVIQKNLLHVSEIYREEYIRVVSKELLEQSTMVTLSALVKAVPVSLETSHNVKKEGYYERESKTTSKFVILPGFHLVEETTTIHARQRYYLVSDGSNEHRDFIIHVPVEATSRRSYTEANEPLKKDEL
jgi:hypothetical protein